MSSYGVIVPFSRLLIIVNPQPNDRVEKVLVITPSITESAIKIQEYEEGIHSMLLDEWHAYTTISMMFTTNHNSVATVRLLDGSQLFGDERDSEGAMMIARFVMLYESGCAKGLSGEKIIDHSVMIHGNDDDEEEEEENEEEEGEDEEEICVICQKEFEAGEICHTLKCWHWYHKECIDVWLNHNKLCPICRDKVYS